ncbi:NtaA/DmoA family FMN-dependent monooxygenase [Gordonia jinghuaiqii]|uniref:LLM class flavin-dependent oxidoreductase n=1 Tax=Gordonia jinghuaiqii TaxID=2758710 RepID=A0A7D7QN48_9ACTN|nr:LLM class flavin-dependent oxidoreductase [Gordonia jinghuaiqii]MCR5976955.1 NtaA/DmoA family FMN-dependent monooxygenase [Gordonia jinghuaiqii]QMT00426.1 LLM class flavin-dependent oxidoreductase [Gordonia jinghuaiqii]
MSKNIHLLGFIQNGVNSHATGMWRHPRDKVNWKFTDPEYWEHMARVMERGLFDGVFIADELAPYNTYQDSSDATVKYAVQCPTHEPSTIVPIITGATEHLGVGVTLSTAFEHPYSMCRRLSSLDHLSGGRVAWNVVSSYSKSEWDAYGQEMAPRGDRYDRLEEYMEVCYKLWDSWEPDAIIADAESGVYADPDKVAVVDHKGEYYQCRGRHFVAPSPQGRPVLWQAGGSPRGRDFAAKHAEAIFAVHPNIERMKEYTSDLDARVVTFDRAPGDVKYFFGVQTVVAETHDEAVAKYERIRSCIPLEGALAWISGHFGLDFSTIDLEDFVQDIEVPGIQGLFESILYAKGGEPVTVREAAQIYAMGMGMPVLVGTPAEIADQLEAYADGGGADGFMLIATYTPGCYEEFVDMVVPELQRRGRYRTQYTGATLRDHLLES